MTLQTKLYLIKAPAVDSICDGCGRDLNGRAYFTLYTDTLYPEGVYCDMDCLAKHCFVDADEMEIADRLCDEEQSCRGSC